MYKASTQNHWKSQLLLGLTALLSIIDARVHLLHRLLNRQRVGGKDEHCKVKKCLHFRQQGDRKKSKNDFLGKKVVSSKMRKNLMT